MEDNYIVRIYRRDRNNPQNLVGIVEIVERGEEQAFHNFEELWMILTDRKNTASRKEKNLNP